MSLRCRVRLVLVGGIVFLFLFSTIGISQYPKTETQHAKDNDRILWSYPLQAPSFGSAATDDIDEDGALEIVFGTYFNDEHIYALNAEDGSLLWNYDTGGCNDASPVIADVDLDGHLEVVIPASSPSLVYCFDGRDGSVKWTRSTGSSNCIDSPPAVADVDNDDKPEILLGTFYGNVFCLNGEDGSICWQKNLGSDSYIQSEPAVLDLNNDGQLDVVVAQFAGDCRVYALFANNGSILWFSDLPSDYMYHGCSFADIDADGKPELVIGSYDHHLYVFNGEDGSLAWEYTAPFYIGAPTSIGDVNNDGFYEIVFTSYNILGVLSHNGSLLWDLTTGGDLFRGAALADINADGVLDVLFGSYDGIFRAVRGDSGQVIWTYDLQSEYGRVFEMDHAPVIADFNGDGNIDVFIVGGYGSSDPPTNNYGCAYALTAGESSQPGWSMFRHDSRHSGCISISSNQPPSISNTTGARYGRPGVNYTFCVTGSDPDGDQVYYFWDWGDGSTSGWIGPYPSGEEVCVMHAWSSEGFYALRVKMKDESGAESEWSVPFSFCVDGTPPVVQIMKPQPGVLYLLDKSVSRFFVTLVIGKLTVEAAAADNLSGVSYVQFSVDSDVRGNVSTPPFRWIWNERSFFRHLIQVSAYDLAGNVAGKQIVVWKLL